ncbi:MAG: prolipoprotein diacylglyceryl transferase [Alphaproteobacteria bacterium]|nr:prolipoprotein diacylglyceryl transferase [Alphaproteobacteria bacterium]
MALAHLPPHSSERWLDRWPRPTVRLGDRLVPVYLLMGMLACWAGGLVTLTAGTVGGVGPALACLVVLLSIGGMLAWVALRRRLSGTESFIAIENLLAATLPVLALDAGLGAGGALLDIQALGLGTFMVFGRIGCFLNGCCYGAPSDVGVCYQHGHHDPSVRRFPAQLVASAGWALIVVAALACWVVAPTRSALACVLIGYGPLRLANEFLRGDPRPRVAGWTTGSIGAVLVWVLGLLVAPTRALWVPAVATLMVVGAVATSSRWLRIRRVELPEPWLPEALSEVPTHHEWAGYRLAASAHQGEMYLSVSAVTGLLSEAEAAMVLSHHAMGDPVRIAPGLFVASRRIPQQAQVGGDYLRREPAVPLANRPG